MYPLRGVPLSSIAAADLQGLVDDRVPEGRHVDWKQAPYGRDDLAKAEIAKDVTAFANTEGGDLVLGVAGDQQGRAATLLGLDVNPEKEIRRIEQIVKNWTSPRLKVACHAIDLGTGKCAIIVRVPRSWEAPHAVWGGDRISKFWYRATQHTEQMEVEQIRAAMNQHANLRDRIQEFRERRLKVIADRYGPAARLNYAPKTILHIVPFTAFDPGRLIKIDLRRSDGLSPPFTPSGAFNFGFNADGPLLYRQSGTDGHGSYLQVFRNGCIEGVDNSLTEGKDAERKNITGIGLGGGLRESIRQYTALLAAAGEPGPVAILLSMIGFVGYAIRSEGNVPIDREAVILPEVIVDSTEDLDLDQTTRQLFDMIWNACGIEKCPYFNDEGRWVG